MVKKASAGMWPLPPSGSDKNDDDDGGGADDDDVGNIAKIYMN